jgi:hypothetical protein
MANGALLNYFCECCFVFLKAYCNKKRFAISAKKGNNRKIKIYFKIINESKKIIYIF